LVAPSVEAPYMGIKMKDRLGPSFKWFFI